MEQSAPLSTDDLATLRRQINDSQALVSEQEDKLRQQIDENEMLTRRRDELETRLAALEQDYEELLEKTVHDDEANEGEFAAESAQELRVRLSLPFPLDRA